VTIVELVVFVFILVDAGRCERASAFAFLGLRLLMLGEGDASREGILQALEAGGIILWPRLLEQAGVGLLDLYQARARLQSEDGEGGRINRSRLAGYPARG
jgi:hypothetical protein